MRAIRFTSNFLTTTIFVFTLAVAVQAQQRVFVSGLGDDSNPCTRTSPCRNFQRGHDVVASGGEVVALDSAGYGQLTITKSVSITGDGVHAGITATSGNGVTIATAGVTVNLRSLTIDGLGSGDSGIYATNFTGLHIESCILNGFVKEGISVRTSLTSKVFIKDSSARNNGNMGIFIIGATSTVEATRAENNFLGFFINGARVTLRDCVSAGNLTDGFTSVADAVLNIESSVAANNGQTGIHNGGATVRVANSMITNNTGYGFSNDTGTFESRGNNTVAGNHPIGVQNNGTITVIAGL